ncbi:MAG: RNA-binding protein, partial [Candidatus Bathyarchaeia archaeon]
MTGEVFKAKVRGIYTTALTKILLDNGFKIVQPSKTIKERFNLPETIGEEQQPDAEIFDRLDKQGVNIVGKAAAANRIASILLD